MPIALFKKGEILAFPLKNGNFSALIILEEILSVDYHCTLVACTDVNKTSIPTIEDVANSNILVKYAQEPEIVKFKPIITGCFPQKSKEIRNTFIKVGEASVKENYTGNFMNFGLCRWPFLIESANLYLVDKEAMPNEIIPAKKYIQIGGNWLKKLFSK